MKYLVVVITLIGGGEEVHQISLEPMWNCQEMADRENLKRGWMKINYRQLRKVNPRIIRFKLECRENIDGAAN